MAIKTKTQVKSKFQTGNKPTSGNYIDFIDSTVFIDTPSTGGINSIEGSGSFGYIIGTVGTPVQPNITSISSITSETQINGTISSHITCSSNISATGYISASGFISAEGNSVLKGLPTTETDIIGSLWLSGSSASGTSKYLMVFTG